MIVATPRFFLLGLLSVGVVSLPQASAWVWGLPLVLVALTLLDAWLLDPAAVTIGRRVAARLPLGEPCQVHLELVNRAAVPVRLHVVDSPPDAFWRDPSPARRFVTVAARGHAAVHYQVRADRRGAYRFDAVYLRLEGALGLAQRQAIRPQEQAVQVYPSFGDKKQVELLERRLRMGAFGLRLRRLPGEGTDFETLRDYVPDDDVRWIDWNATARTSRPMTRTYQVERSQTLYVLLDAGRLMASRVSGSLTKLDHALNATVILAWMALRQGDRVGVTAFADRLLASVVTKGGRSHLSAIMDALFDLQPHFTESNLEAAVTDLRKHQRRRALVVLFTDFQDMTAARRLLAYVALLRPTHLPMVVSLRDERLLAVAARVPKNQADMYQVGVAGELLLERQQILAELRRLGALTVETDAQHIGLHTVQKYLDAKLANRL